MTELWGLGDVALAIPFLQTATRHARVRLLAQPHARPLLQRFAPAVELIELTAPWTAFTGKYRLHRWPWRDLARVRAALERRRFDLAVSARRDPRDHLLLAWAGPAARFGFPRAGSHLWLTHPQRPPAEPHRAAHWDALAATLGWERPARPAAISPATIRRIALHPGAGHAVRRWPAERFAELAARLRDRGYLVDVLAEPFGRIEELLTALERADAFIGNDSGPGHLAALLGRPTFTIFGPQLPALFAPVHPQAAWIEGGPCPHKPCFDRCRFASPHCLDHTTVDAVTAAVHRWLGLAP